MDTMLHFWESLHKAPPQSPSTKACVTPMFPQTLGSLAALSRVVCFNRIERSHSTLSKERNNKRWTNGNTTSKTSKTSKTTPNTPSTSSDQHSNTSHPINPTKQRRKKEREREREREREPCSHAHTHTHIRPAALLHAHVIKRIETGFVFEVSMPRNLHGRNGSSVQCSRASLPTGHAAHVFHTK